MAESSELHGIQEALRGVNAHLGTQDRTLSEQNGMLIGHTQQLDTIKATVKRVEYVLEGNGKPGLIEDVTILKLQMADALGAKSLWKSALVTALVSSIVSLIITGVAAAFWIAVK